jgi:uncharacterized protein HemX
MAIERRVTTETSATPEPPYSSERYVRTEKEKSGGNGFLYFAVGALIVAVAGLGYMYWSGQQTADQKQTAMERQIDSIGDAADNLGDTVREAARNVQRQPQTQPAPQPVQPAQPAQPQLSPAPAPPVQ